MLVMGRELRERPFVGRPAGYAARVTEPEELDRDVSRRVHNPTAATQDDEQAYRAADPGTEPEADTRSGGEGGASERAAREQVEDDESEPTRSE
jgi:hypothetical protein